MASRHTHLLLQTKARLQSLLHDPSCFICYEDFNTTDKLPVMICLKQHLCCQGCLALWDRCPMCRIPVNSKMISRH